MALPREVPADFDTLVQQWDRFITATIFQVSRGAVRTDDLPDLKQAVYLRIHQKDYLARCRTLIGERGGAFSTYLFLLVRSVCVNAFKSNTRNPLNCAVGVVQTQLRVGGAPDPSHADALVLETFMDLVDDRLARQYEAREWLDQFARHLEAIPPADATTVTLPDGSPARWSLAVLFQLWRQFSPDGIGWQSSVAALVGINPAVVSTTMRRLRHQAVLFRALQAA